MKSLGDISIGRPNLGTEVPVLVYRLFALSMADILEKRYDKETSDHLIREAGLQSGKIFAKQFLNLKLDFEDFIFDLEKKLADNKIGILRIEYADIEAGELIITIYEDLDCSGLPIYDETICVYDEGFLAGVLELYAGKVFQVSEVDCWANGDRACRFFARSL